MGKKSKRRPLKEKKNGVVDEKEKEKPFTIPACDESYARLLFSMETRPSSIHGNGVFATLPIKAGVYETKNPDLVSINCREFRMNAVGTPPWRKILLETFGLEDPPLTGENFQDLFDDSNKKRLKEAWSTYVEGEKSESNITSQMSPIICQGKEVLIGDVVTVRKDVECGEELLRNYGHEWLGITYNDKLKDKLSSLAEWAECYDQDFTKVLFVDMNDMELNDFEHSYDLSREDVCRKIIGEEKLEGKDLVEANTSSVRFFMMCLEYLAECFVLGRNPLLENTWFKDDEQLAERLKNLTVSVV